MLEAIKRRIIELNVQREKLEEELAGVTRSIQELEDLMDLGDEDEQGVDVEESVTDSTAEVMLGAAPTCPGIEQIEASMKTVLVRSKAVSVQRSIPKLLLRDGVIAETMAGVECKSETMKGINSVLEQSRVNNGPFRVVKSGVREGMIYYDASRE